MCPDIGLYRSEDNSVRLSNRRFWRSSDVGRRSARSYLQEESTKRHGRRRVTSGGYAVDESKQGSGIEPAVYTRVDHFLDWIV